MENKPPPESAAISGGSAKRRRVAKAKGKPRGRPFPKGKSGNPSGRPPLPPGYKEAFDVLEPMSWAAMQEILAEPGHKDRGDIAKYVTNRRRGMPTQRSEITGADGKPVEVTGAPEIVAALKKIAGEE